MYLGNIQGQLKVWSFLSDLHPSDDLMLFQNCSSSSWSLPCNYYALNSTMLLLFSIIILIRRVDTWLTWLVVLIIQHFGIGIHCNNSLVPWIYSILSIPMQWIVKWIKQPTRILRTPDILKALHILMWVWLSDEWTSISLRMRHIFSKLIYGSCGIPIPLYFHPLYQVPLKVPLRCEYPQPLPQNSNQMLVPQPNGPFGSLINWVYLRSVSMNSVGRIGRRR